MRLVSRTGGIHSYGEERDSLAGQVCQPLLTKTAGNGHRFPVSIVVHHQAHRLMKIGKRSGHLPAGPESHEMHGTDFRLVTVTLFKLAVHSLSCSVDADRMAAVQPHESIEPLLHRGLVGNLNQEGGTEFVFRR